MAEVVIATPRGVDLAGSFEPGPGDAAVLFAHGFLSDRHSSTYFDQLAARYAAAGYATLQIDFSGCGASGEDVVTIAGEVEDLHSASGWLAEHGYPRQAVHGHAFGALAALRARPDAVGTMVLTDPLTGPMSYPWEEIFAAAQLDELEAAGYTRVPDDNATSPREHSVISRTTLADLSLIDQQELLGPVRTPVLMIHSYGEDASHVDHTREGLALLAAGSRVEVLDGPGQGPLERVDAIGRLTLAWLENHLPV